MVCSKEAPERSVQKKKPVGKLGAQFVPFPMAENENLLWKVPKKWRKEKHENENRFSKFLKKWLKEENENQNLIVKLPKKKNDVSKKNVKEFDPTSTMGPKSLLHLLMTLITMLISQPTKMLKLKINKKY